MIDFAQTRYLYVLIRMCVVAVNGRTCLNRYLWNGGYCLDLLLQKFLRISRFFFKDRDRELSVSKVQSGIGSLLAGKMATSTAFILETEEFIRKLLIE